MLGRRVIRSYFSQSQKQGYSLKQLVTWFKGLNKSSWKTLGLVLGTSILIYNTNAFFDRLSLREHPQNIFYNNIVSNNHSYMNIVPRIKMAINNRAEYLIYFTLAGEKNVVNFGPNVGRFEECVSLLQSKGTPVDLEYTSNFQRRLLIPHYVCSIIGAGLMFWFIMRSSSLNISSAKDKSGLAQQILNQKKNFDVVHKTGVKFKDVAGLEESKREVLQFVDFLKNPEKYKKLGARIPRGVLLGGPPGTGKTLLAKACAGEAGVPFIPCSGSDFVEVFVGVGASRIRDLFAAARLKSPSIIFIDEIDAVGRKRSGSEGSHDERDSTLNQILVEMDGFNTDQNVIVMAATNKMNLLDPALIRPGRFDRIVQVNLPDLQGRRQILNVHLSKITLSKARNKEEYARRLASLTPGFSGADIANLCNEAAILAARNNKDEVDAHDFEMATERIIGGIEKLNLMTKKEKKVVAVHESGHAVVAWFLESASPLLKLSIIPRSKGALGFAQYFSNENKLQTKTELVERLCFILGGRCAEKEFFGTVTNGAADDLQKAYQIAHNIVAQLGMNDKIGYVGFIGNQYLRPYSNKKGEEVDREIINLLAECTNRTIELVKMHKSKIQELSERLLEKETLTVKEIRQILGERPFDTNVEYNKYLQIQSQEASKQV